MANQSRSPPAPADALSPSIHLRLLLILLILIVFEISGVFGGKSSRYRIPDELDDVVDDEEDDTWKEWGKKKKATDDVFDPPPTDFSEMDLGQMQDEMMKRHYGPSFGFVKLRLGVRRTTDMITNMAMKWSKVARTGGIEVKFMGVDVSTIMFTLEKGQDTLELKEFILSQPEAYEIKIGDQLFRRPGDRSFDDVFAELHANDYNDEVQFDAIVKLSEENIRRVKEFWKIEENVRSFRAVSVIPSSSQNTEQSHNIMSKKKLFELDDINSMLSIKEEKSGSPAVKSRAGLRSSKKRKTTEVIDLDSQTAGMEKVQEGLKMMAEERRLVYVDLQDVLAQKQTIHEKNAALQQKVLGLNKEIQDLKSSMTLQIDETIENAKHSAIVSILQAKIQMAREAQEKGLDIWNKQVESWSQALEKIEDKEAAGTLEKVAEKEDNTGTSVEAAQKEKDEVEGTTAPRVGDEGYNA